SKKKKQLQGWKHSAAGSLGGMTGAIVTSPFDVVKTRLQSDMFKHHDSLPTKTIRRGGAWHFVDTVYMIRRIAVDEGWRALYKGLGPSLVGIIPARAINFYFYPTSKAYLAERFPNAPTEKEGQTAEDSPLIHLGAAVIAGITTATGTNPIWVVKTRLQLSARKIQPSSSSPILQPSPIPSSSGLPKPIIQSIAALPHLPSSTPSSSITPSRLSALDMTLQIIRQEGFRGLYRGLSASYLGVSEGVIQWVLYERFKRLNSDKPPSSKSQSLAAYITGIVSASGGAKAVASLITYPHEVVRTRLRQPDVGGKKRYTGLIQCLRLVIKEEGVKGLYGGLTAHMFRVVPNAACMFLIYELVAERLGS
ncbi:hypothetical protein TREMEDRAFT_15966, partial [Tremella mesenterica DSM 1558]|uniref:uncharacterized protein n=1 Tax=Tremella mesenterica (strain ATCC 24925 / CBS 8224 / DSM 1558 / NBRC 9311 / NRRL Y-6157 / RJB 2259-6 / UBC 559-6) TaxID=578456 RepID=UPI0003F49F11